MLRKKKKRRTYFGEDIADSLCEWLNDSDFAQEHPELIELIELAAGHRATQGHSLIRRANDVLSEIKFAPLVDDIDGATWEVSWIPREHIESGEGFVVYDFLELAKLGLLPRLRRCTREKCGKWFFAKFSHNDFHSIKCREADARENPEKRAKRRDYGRRYYRENRKK